MAITVFSYNETVYNVSSPKSIASIAWDAGDVIVVMTASGDDSTTVDAPVNANLTFTSRQTSGVVADECWTRIWTAKAASTQTGQTIQQTLTSGSNAWGFSVHVLRGVDDYRGGWQNFNESATSYTPLAGAIVIHLIADWNTTAAGRTGTTASGTLTERKDSQIAGQFSIWIGDWAGVSAGSQSFGITSYTGMKASQLGIEVTAQGAVPDAPTGVVGRPADTAVALDWTLGGDGGSAITDHDIDWAEAATPTTWLGPVATGSTSPNGSVTGLTNGTAYVFRVRAVNAVGDGTWSASSAEVIPDVQSPVQLAGAPIQSAERLA